MKIFPLHFHCTAMRRVDTFFIQIAFMFLLYLISLAVVSASRRHSSDSTPSDSLVLPSDASALLAFKLKADPNHKLRFDPNTTFCEWRGVKCQKSRAVRLVIEGMGLAGAFAPNTVSRLDQLRVLSLQNNLLAGPFPDLSGLINLKALFLDHNFFTGSLPPSISTLHRLRTLDLSFNNFTGPIPLAFTKLDRLYYLRLDSNRFSGSVPPLNQSSLLVFNVSRNNLTGALPVTPTLLRFSTSSFALNPGLCGEIIHKECHSAAPFFGPSTSASPPPKPSELGQNEQVNQGMEIKESSPRKHKRTAMIVGFSSVVFVLIGSAFCFVIALKKKKSPKVSTPSTMALDSNAATNAAAVMRIEEENELEEKVKRVQEGIQMEKSGNLIFCAGEVQLYSMEQLMRASAELLGRGTMGTTYKAVMDNRLIVTVKRLDAGKLAGTSNDTFERHMESVSGLRHPNLVPLRAYFQAKEERLLIYDYQPNGSLFSLIHGSKSTRAKPLHWTSCLKIAEDVGQGLAYIHQAWRLVHGNLKSCNVLLGADFEACLSDYCLSVLAADSSPNENNPDGAFHIAPEARKPTHHEATAKADVYAFGVLLLELITGKHPSEHPTSLRPNNMIQWVRSSRDDENEIGGPDSRLEMLLEVAVACRATSPEQRPTMWQVLKMIQEIKEVVVMVEDGTELEASLTGESS